MSINEFNFLKPLTFVEMLGCRRPKRSWNEYGYCDTKRGKESDPQKFISTFTLGRDIYLQKSGRIWRYLNRGFTSDSLGPFNRADKVVSLRYDANTLDFLERQGFG